MKQVTVIVPSFALVFSEEDNVSTYFMPQHYNLNARVSDAIQAAILDSIDDQLSKEGYKNIKVSQCGLLDIPEVIHADKKGNK